LPSPASILKLHAYKIATSPDDLALADIVKHVERKLELEGQDVEVVQLNSRAAVRYIPDVASKDAALFIEKQHCILRDRRSGNSASLSHAAVIKDSKFIGIARKR
jgi:hypothetical protein